MRTFTMTVAIAALFAATATLHASERSGRVGELHAAKEHIAREANQTKGGAQHLLLMRKARVSELLDRVDRGERVDPAEIDRLLEENPTAR